MNENKSIIVRKRDLQRNTCVNDYGLKFLKVVPKRQKNYEEESNNAGASKCEKKRHHLKNKQRYSKINAHLGDIQTCNQVLCDNLAKKHSSEIKIGQIRSVKRKKFKKIYLPEIVDNGVGSFDLSTIRKRRHRKTTSSKCVGAIFECTTNNSKNKVKSHLTVTKSMGTGPSDPTTLIIVHQKGSQRDKKGVKDIKLTTENISATSKGDTLTHSESSSLLTEIHDFLLANNITTGEVKSKLVDQVSQVPVECSKSSKRKIKSCLKSNEITEFKSSSSLRQKYEKLLTGDSAKEVTDDKIMQGDVKSDGFDNVSKQSNVEMSNNTYGMTIPEKSSFSGSDTNMLNMLSQDDPYYNDEDVPPLDNEGIKGMFKLWSRRFHLDDDNNRQNETSSFLVSYNDKAGDLEQSQKKQKRFFNFKRKSKSKNNSYKSNKPIITGICQVKEGVMIKMEPSKPTSFSYNSSKKVLRSKNDKDYSSAQNWIQAFKSKEYDNQGSVHIRWYNKTFSGSSSTVFKLMNDVYNHPETMFPSKSEMIQNEFSRGPIRRPIVPRSSFANRSYQAWMIHKVFNTPRPTHTRTNKSEQLNKEHNVEIKITNKKWFIEKSKAFSHRIEVVLHSKNIMKSKNKDVSEEFIKIDIPKGFFNESSSGADTKINGYSDETVYNVIDYEMASSIGTSDQKKLDKEKLNLSIGDHKISNEQDIVKQKSEILCRPPTNNGISIPKKIDVVGDGVITRGDVDIVRRPMYNTSNETLCNGSQVSLKRVENNCEFAESSLQDYYKNWMPLSLDVYSWCIDGSKIQCKNSQHCDEESITEDSTSSSESCSTLGEELNDSTEIITTSLNKLSFSEHTIDTESQKMSEKKYPFNFFRKIKTWTLSKTNQEPLRPMPKDSLEVTKRRKVCARIKESANKNQCCKGSKIDLILSKKPCDGKKQVFVYDRERNEFVPPGILKFKTTDSDCDVSCPKSLENSYSDCTILSKQFKDLRRMPYTSSKNNYIHGSSSSCYVPNSPRKSPQYSNRSFSPKRRPQPLSPISRRSPHGSPNYRPPGPPQSHRSPNSQHSLDRRPPEPRTPPYLNRRLKESSHSPGTVAWYPKNETQHNLNTNLNRKSPLGSPPHLKRRLEDDSHCPGTGANSSSSLNRRSPPQNKIPPRPPKYPSPQRLIRQNPGSPPLLSKKSDKQGSRQRLRKPAYEFISTASSTIEFKPCCGHPKCPVSPPMIDISSFKTSIKKLLSTYVEPKEEHCGDPLCPCAKLRENNKLLSKSPCGDPICPTKRYPKVNKIKVEVKHNSHITSSSKLPTAVSPLGDITIASVLSNALKNGFEGCSSHSSNKQIIYNRDSKFPITSVISKIIKKTMRGISAASAYGSNKKGKSVSPDVGISQCDDPSCQTTTSLAPCPMAPASKENNNSKSFGTATSVLINSNPSNAFQTVLNRVDSNKAQKKMPWKEPQFIVRKEAGTKCSYIVCNDENEKRCCCFKRNKFCTNQKPSGKPSLMNHEREISGIDYSLPQCQNPDCYRAPKNQTKSKFHKTKQNPQDRAGVKCTPSKQTSCDFYPPPPPVPRNTVALDSQGPSLYNNQNQENPLPNNKSYSPPKTKKNIEKELKCDGTCVARFDRPKNMTNKNVDSRTASMKNLRDSDLSLVKTPKEKETSREVNEKGIKLPLPGKPLGDPRTDSSKSLRGSHPRLVKTPKEKKIPREVNEKGIKLPLPGKPLGDPRTDSSKSLRARFVRPKNTTKKNVDSRTASNKSLRGSDPRLVKTPKKNEIPREVNEKGIKSPLPGKPLGDPRTDSSKSLRGSNPRLVKTPKEKEIPREVNEKEIKLPLPGKPLGDPRTDSSKSLRARFDRPKNTRKKNVDSRTASNKSLRGSDSGLVKTPKEKEIPREVNEKGIKLPLPGKPLGDPRTDSSKSLRARFDRPKNTTKKNVDSRTASNKSLRGSDPCLVKTPKEKEIPREVNEKGIKLPLPGKPLGDPRTDSSKSLRGSNPRLVKTPKEKEIPREVNEKGIKLPLPGKPLGDPRTDSSKSLRARFDRPKNTTKKNVDSRTASNKSLRGSDPRLVKTPKEKKETPREVNEKGIKLPLPGKPLGDPRTDSSKSLRGSDLRLVKTPKEKKETPREVNEKGIKLPLPGKPLGDPRTDSSKSLRGSDPRLVKTPKEKKESPREVNEKGIKLPLPGKPLGDPRTDSSKSLRGSDPRLVKKPKEKKKTPKEVNEEGIKLSLPEKPLGDPIRPQDNDSSKSDESGDGFCGDPRCLMFKGMSKGDTVNSGTNTTSESKHFVAKPNVVRLKTEKRKNVECECKKSPLPNNANITYQWPLHSNVSRQSTIQHKTHPSLPHQPPKRDIAPLVDDDGVNIIPSAAYLRRNSICHSPKLSQPPMSKPSYCDKLVGVKLYNPTSNVSELIVCDSSIQYKIRKMHSIQNIALNGKISSDIMHKCKGNDKDNSTTDNELCNANINVTSLNNERKIEKAYCKKTDFSKTLSNKSESDSTVSNTVEINFKLKFKKGDKSTEINFGNDGDKMEKDCRSVNKSPQEIYLLREKDEKLDLKDSRKNDLNIKIIIQNYNKSTPIDKNKMKSDKVNIKEFSQNISQKLCSVSTYYSEVLLLDKETIPDGIISVAVEPTNLSVHRATIELALTDKSEENLKSSSTSLASIKTSLSLKTSHVVTTSLSDTSFSKNEDSQILNVNKSNTIYDKTNFEEIKELTHDETISHTSISSVTAHHTVSTVNELTENECSKSKDKLSISRSFSIQDKKDALINLGEVLINKEHTQENVKEFRTMLKEILTSSASNSATSKENEKSLSKLMESTSSAERDSTKNYPSLDDGSNIDVSNYSKNTCCSGNRPNGCLCGLLATRINATRKSINDLQPACCCRKKQQPISRIDEYVNCDIETRVELDFSEFNIKTCSKEVEADFESKETSIHKASKESDKTSCDILSKNDHYLNDQEVEILNNILDSVTQKRENEIKSVSAKSSGNRRYANQIKNNKHSIVDTNADKFGVIHSKYSGTSMETMFFKELKRSKLRNNIRILKRNIDDKLLEAADVLQSYETKKAVLQIYAEKTMSESHFTAKLPKFIYNDSFEDCSVEIRELTTSQKSCSNGYNIKRNVLMVSIER